MHSAYQIFVMLILMYLGQYIFFTESFDLVTAPPRDKEGKPTDRLILDTMCFHTFILMNLFNQINCRVVEANELNVFITLNPIRHPMFFLVIAFEFAI